jgi:hypothetical protein
LCQPDQSPLVHLFITKIVRFFQHWLFQKLFLMISGILLEPQIRWEYILSQMASSVMVLRLVRFSLYTLHKESDQMKLFDNHVPKRQFHCFLLAVALGFWARTCRQVMLFGV